MPRDDDVERIRKAQREVAANLPEGMVGEDSEDVRDVRRRGEDEAPADDKR